MPKSALLLEAQLQQDESSNDAHHLLLQGAGEAADNLLFCETDRESHHAVFIKKLMEMMMLLSMTIPVMAACWLTLISSSPSEMCLTAASVSTLLLLGLLGLVLESSEEL